MTGPGDDDIIVYADDEPFVMLPESVLYHPKISDRAVRLWATLKRHAGPEGRICPGRTRLASLLGGRSLDTIDRTKAELVEHDLLEIINRWWCAECQIVLSEKCNRDGHASRRLVNHYRLRSPQVAADVRLGVAAGVRLGGSRRSAARGSRSGAAGVAAGVRPKREQENESKTTRGARAARLPADFEVTDAMSEWADSYGATRAGLDLDRATERFRDHFTANGKLMKDWVACWRNWIRRDVDALPTPGPRLVPEPGADDRGTFLPGTGWVEGSVG